MADLFSRGYEFSPPSGRAPLSTRSECAFPMQGRLSNQSMFRAYDCDDMPDPSVEQSQLLCPYPYSYSQVPQKPMWYARETSVSQSQSE